MDINVEKLTYYLGGVGFVLLVGVVYYFIRGKKAVEEELKKREEEEEEARIAERNQGLYTLCPTNPNDSGGTEAVPDIVISDPDGELHSKIHTVPPRVLYTNCPKTEEEWVNVRRDAVIQMIIAEGGEPFH